MTRYGIIADPHGNEEALVASLERLNAERVDRIICLGDLVGYNAGPNECVRRLVEGGVDCIEGNHDRIALGHLGFSRCADKVIYALRQTRRDLSVWSRAYLQNLPARRFFEGKILAVHGGLTDVEQYLRTPAEVQGTAAGVAARYPEARLLLFAHTHERKLFVARDGGVFEQEIGAEPISLPRDRLTLINPGSVDAARKRVPGNPRVRDAEAMILDAESWTVRFLRVPYDHAASEARARARGYRISTAAARVYQVQRWFRETRAAFERRLVPSHAGDLGPGLA